MRLENIARGQGPGARGKGQAPVMDPSDRLPYFGSFVLGVFHVLFHVFHDACSFPSGNRLEGH